MFPLPGVTLKIGKKRGMYCNWEFAMAHAESVNSPIELAATRKQILLKIGLVPNPAPHYSQLNCFGGDMNDTEYIMECELETGELDIIRSNVKGHAESVTLDSVCGRFISHPDWHFSHVQYKCPPDSEIVALTDYTIPEVYMVKRSLLEPWRHSPRYIDLTLNDYKSLGDATYKRFALQSQLNNYEARVSKDAVLPATLLKGRKLPGKSGKAIAEYAELHMGRDLRCLPLAPAPAEVLAKK